MFGTIVTLFMPIVLQVFNLNIKTNYLSCSMFITGLHSHTPDKTHYNIVVRKPCTLNMNNVLCNQWEVGLASGRGSGHKTSVK